MHLNIRLDLEVDLSIFRIGLGKFPDTSEMQYDIMVKSDPFNKNQGGKNGLIVDSFKAKVKLIPYRFRKKDTAKVDHLSRKYVNQCRVVI